MLANKALQLLQQLGVCKLCKWAMDRRIIGQPPLNRKGGVPHPPPSQMPVLLPPPAARLLPLVERQSVEKLH